MPTGLVCLQACGKDQKTGTALRCKSFSMLQSKHIYNVWETLSSWGEYENLNLSYQSRVAVDIFRRDRQGTDWADDLHAFIGRTSH